MTANNSTTDGLGFEEVNQTESSTENIIGTTISGTNVYGTTVSGLEVFGRDIYNGDGDLQSIGTGSPIEYGLSTLVGIGSLSTGSSVWIVYPSDFDENPMIFTTNKTSVGEAIVVGSISTGSFIALGNNASDKFNWLAIGL